MIEIKITLDDTGRVNVSGPLDNRMTMYGLLMIAADVCRKQAFDAENRLVQPAKFLPPRS